MYFKKADGMDDEWINAKDAFIPCTFCGRTYMVYQMKEYSRDGEIAIACLECRGITVS